MKILITGICGFVGGALASELKRRQENLEIIGLDNLCRRGSELNRHRFQPPAVSFRHGDIRNPSDLDDLPKVDWVIDAAANPSVLAGVSGLTSSRQLMEHNLVGTLNLLEYCKRHGAGFILLGTSRVYSAARLAALPLDTRNQAFIPRFAEIRERGVAPAGVTEDFSTQPPLSLYGSAKLASELLILEYGQAFNLPVLVNRCGVLAGAGQFGKPDQGIFTFWIHSYHQKRPLKYIGFGGTGHQVRDCLHPRDLAALMALQLRHPEKAGGVLNVSGGPANSLSLAQLSDWCAARFGRREIQGDPALRRYDVPWLVLDSTRATQAWNWRPDTKLEDILGEIAGHAEQHPEWLDLSAGA
ncbi:MAG TPA: NAD-dependent epimerase/dehydratase family protein [Candidatus Acidoferrum sp.]|nr:NAD-dependent epimerase/dehydratase family protein [Candidatus Acidoferrum sp.]